MKTKLFVLLVSLLTWSQVFAEIREIAITIDDLPFVGSANHDPRKLQREHDRFINIMQALIDRKVPATGFIIAGSIEKGQWELLEAFRNQGFELGNHTYSHRSLNSVSAEKYIEDVAKADDILTPLMTSPKYFRYPYLAESKGERRDKVYEFLADSGYIIAPVTVDSKDFRFNSQLFAIPYRQRPQRLNYLKKRYLNFIWQQTLRAEAKAEKKHPGVSRQILLIHANLLNSHFMGDIIDMYQEKGYRIVRLDQILAHTETGEETENGDNDKPAAGAVSDVVNDIFQ
ncbi:polysaccharide deacetylase family protein [Legionella spiritensis]|uniref:polysaccharide deacetylase family protein n=1 Tax=Legionella spiritensis TaxID=452 RepID=UPI000F6BB816|nr:polysaccharide deacetylase family protein [Legionella spiritensis]VEG91620.1 polysaccharide deacetylase [Legionella spiritensis]